MALAKYGNKRDANEPEIVGVLEGHGFSVIRLDTPVDLLCGIFGQNYLVEVKTPKGKLTGPQDAFAGSWRGSFVIIRSVDEATEFAKATRRDAIDAWMGSHRDA